MQFMVKSECVNISLVVEIKICETIYKSCMMALMKELFLCRMPPVAFYLAYRKETLRCKTWTITKQLRCKWRKFENTFTWQCKEILKSRHVQHMGQNVSLNFLYYLFSQYCDGKVPERYWSENWFYSYAILSR